MSRVVAIDPGRSKCGLILADLRQDVVLSGLVLEADAVLDALHDWAEDQPLAQILIGDGTGCSSHQAFLRQLATVRVIPERGTTLRARQRYWDLWPPHGWRKLLPDGLRLPPDQLDAVAALVMLEDTMERRLHWPGPKPNFDVRTWPAR